MKVVVEEEEKEEEDEEEEGDSGGDRGKRGGRGAGKEGNEERVRGIMQELKREKPLQNTKKNPNAQNDTLINKTCTFTYTMWGLTEDGPTNCTKKEKIRYLCSNNIYIPHHGDKVWIRSPGKWWQLFGLGSFGDQSLDWLLSKTSSTKEGGWTRG